MKDDPVRVRLKELGASDSVVSGGIKALVSKWESIVKNISTGYTLDLDSYLNDIDVRQLIEEVITRIPDVSSVLLERINAADELMRGSSKHSKCVWGEEVAHKEGWTREKNWWYFRVPKKIQNQERSDWPKTSSW